MTEELTTEELTYIKFLDMCLDKIEDKNFLTEKITQQMKEIDLSYIDRLYEKKYWDVEDIAFVLTKYQLVKDQDQDGDIYQKYNNVFDHYFSILEKGINDGKLICNKAMEVEWMPYTPEKPTFSMIFNPRAYIGYLKEIKHSLNPDNRLLIRYVLSDDVLRYLKEKGIDFPERSSASKKNDSHGEEPQVNVKYSEKQPSISEKKQGQAGTETPSTDNYCSVDSTAVVTAPTLINKEALIKEIRREAGQKKGEKWRIFVSKIIKSAVERELDRGCICLHRDLATILNAELTVQARDFFDKKDFNKLLDELPLRISDSIKLLFCDYGEKYGNVRSRVYRGKHYKEYNHIPCHLHSNK